jgi:hypothetical protein
MVVVVILRMICMCGIMSKTSNTHEKEIIKCMNRRVILNINDKGSGDGV